jgi:hypothetical protein
VHCDICKATLVDERYEVDGQTLCRECASIPGSRLLFRGVRKLTGERARKHLEIAKRQLEILKSREAK